MEMDNLTNSGCCFCLISVARNVTGTPMSTRSQQCSFLDGSRTRQDVLFTQTTLAVSQLTHENSQLQSVRTFQTMLVLHRVHGRVHSTRVFQNSYFNTYTEHQIRSSHGSRARRDETRVSYCSSTRRDQARTSHCVREETRQLRTTPSARIKQKDQFARFDVRGHKLVLGRIYQAGSVR